jgi:hypothetical protein
MPGRTRSAQRVVQCTQNQTRVRVHTTNASRSTAVSAHAAAHAPPIISTARIHCLCAQVWRCAERSPGARVAGDRDMIAMIARHRGRPHKHRKSKKNQMRWKLDAVVETHLRTRAPLAESRSRLSARGKTLVKLGHRLFCCQTLALNSVRTFSPLPLLRRVRHDIGPESLPLPSFPREIGGRGEQFVILRK